MTGKLTKNASLAALTASAIMAALAFACLFILGKAASLPPLSLAKAQKTSVLVTDRNNRLLRPFATKEGRWRLPVNLGDVDKGYIDMLLAYEDKNFYTHNGIDYLALARAAWQLATNGRIISGGSTVTMQLARLLDDLEARSWDAKLTQLIRARQIEQRLSKDEILTLYLTLAPFGGNLEGVRAASLAYFGKEPKRLSWAERALLVALPQSPEKRRPDRRALNALKARNRVLDRAKRKSLISNAENRYAKQNPVPKKRRPFPLHAAHLAEAEIASAPPAPIHKLTLDRSIQVKLEKLSQDHVRRLGPKLSAAILVANHKSGEILGHVGASDYLNKSRFGAINMVEAVRSPGSALKPFIYGLSFDQGIAHPETLIEDRPTRFEDYAPKNFDNKFHGTITLRKALQTSLNIPAVKLLEALGPARLAHKFETYDQDLQIPRNLSIALGGVGMRLKSLATLYAALARGGTHVNLITRTEHRAAPRPNNDAPALLSPKAAWYVTDILAGTPPPKNMKGGNIAFKTGTSYGYRDAWAVGFDGQHIIAVWIGRPDATPTPGLTGITAAAPLLFDAFQAISTKRIPLPPAPASALQLSTAKLPKRLIYFEATNAQNNTSARTEQTLKIAFPPEGAELHLTATGSDHAPMPLALKAQGGKLPLSWLIDGAPIKNANNHSRQRQTFWQRANKGFHKLTVIDAAGQVDRVTIRIR